jgi:Carboxypeptidase regulatory-like domain
MRAAIVGVASVLLGAASALAQVPARDRPEPAGTAVIRGRVMLATGDQPVARADVRATATSLKAPRTTKTDANGRYEITGLPAGRYTVSALKPNYVTASFGESRPGGPGKPFDLADGQAAGDVNFALARAGVIAGRIVDEFGDPFANVQVAVVRLQYMGGQRRIVPAQALVFTNDLGAFRLFGLSPGEYYVSATYRTSGMDSDEHFGYAPIYYPGTSNIADAQRVSIAPGQVVTGVSLTLFPVRAVRASGIALDGAGKPLGGARVLAVPKDNIFGMNAHNTMARPDGSFTVGGLTPGEYVIRTGGLGDDAGETASATITVGSADVTDIQLIGGRPTTVAGRIVFEPGPLPPRSTLRVSLQRREVDPFGGTSARISDDLTFQLKTAPCQCVLTAFAMSAPPANLLPASPAAPHWRVKRVVFNGLDVTDSGIDIPPDSSLTGIVIEMTTRSSEVTGAVTGADQQPDRDATVVAFAQDPGRWRTPTRYVVQSRLGNDDQYHLRLPAGDYFLVAVDSLEGGEWQDPDVLARLRANAVPLSIGEDEKKSLDLKVAPKPF